MGDARKPYVMALAQYKGGTGKSTLAGALAAMLTQRKQSVLAIDLDAQGDMTKAMGLAYGDNAANWLWPDAPKALADCVVRRTGTTLDVVPSGDSTTVLQTAHTDAYSPVNFLGERIAADAAAYDFVVIDTAASGYMLEMALVSADLVVIPVPLQNVDVEGARRFAKARIPLLKEAARVIVVPNKVDRRAQRVMRESMIDLAAVATENAWAIGPPIPESGDINKAFSMGRDVNMLRPQHEVAMQLGLLADLVLRYHAEYVESLKGESANE